MEHWTWRSICINCNKCYKVRIRYNKKPINEKRRRETYGYCENCIKEYKQLKLEQVRLLSDYCL